MTNWLRAHLDAARAHTAAWGRTRGALLSVVVIACAVALPLFPS